LFFGVGPLDLITLAVLVILLFGPDKLPEFIQSAAVVLRKLRELSENAKQEIRSELGPEFEDFELHDLHPKTFVRKHLLDGTDVGLDDVRRLDPRGEFAQVADALRESADEAREGEGLTGGVRLAKPAQPEPTTSSAFDPDAT
jgi:sec-independent protein translocase protein TatB